MQKKSVGICLVLSIVKLVESECILSTYKDSYAVADLEF